MRAKFVSFIRRNPNPPSLRGVHIELQDFRHRFLDLPLGKPHQKSLNILSSAEQTEFGRRKVLIVYNGIVEAVAFIRTASLWIYFFSYCPNYTKCQPIIIIFCFCFPDLLTVCRCFKYSQIRLEMISLYIYIYRKSSYIAFKNLISLCEL
jgi:hypothetical protein